MNVKFPAVLLVVAASVRLLAAEPASAFLLKAKSITRDGQRAIATDQATLITQGSDTKLTADKIVYDQAAETFTLTGQVKIQAGGVTVETSEATVNAAGRRVVQLLAGGQISISGGLPVDTSAPASKLPTFSEPLPRTETKLPMSR